MMSTPKVTVLMPVYNGENFLRETIESILNQTYKDFEFLIIDDGSTDSTVAIVLSYTDQRIRLVRNSNNIGLAGVRNLGIDLARGEYIAWMDADDISLSNRIKKQVELLDKDRTIGLCGTWVKTIGESRKRLWRYPSDPELLRCMMIFEDPIATSSVMLRRSILIDNNLRFGFGCAEDYDLWERFSEYSKVTNIKEVLIYYRVHGGQVSTSENGSAIQRENVRKIQKRQLLRLGINEADTDNIIEELVMSVPKSYSREAMECRRKLIKFLISQNDIVGVYDRKKFNRVIGKRWFEFCLCMAMYSFEVNQYYWKTPMCKDGVTSIRRKWKIFLRSIVPKEFRTKWKAFWRKK